VTQAKLAHVAALLLVAAISFTARDAVAQFPPNQSQSAAFTGAWCAQGDPTRHASIGSNGAFLTLTNENGDTSPGKFQGQTGIVAPGWQFTTGTSARTAAKSTGRTGHSGQGATLGAEEAGTIG
jgi:hypothetical protein